MQGVHVTCYGVPYFLPSLHIVHSYEVYIDDLDIEIKMEIEKKKNIERCISSMGELSFKSVSCFLMFPFALNQYNSTVNSYSLFFV